MVAAFCNCLMEVLLFVGVLVLFVEVDGELVGGKDCVVEGRVYKSGEFFLYRSHFNTSCIDGQAKVVNCVTSRGTSFPLGTLRFSEDDQKPRGRAPKIFGKLEDEVAEECEFGEEQFVREGFAISCVSNELLGCVDEFGDLVREGLYVTAKGALHFCYVYQNKRRARIERQGCFNGTRNDDPNDKRFHFSKGQIWHTKEYDFRCGDDGFQVYKCKPSAKELIHTGVAWFDRENVLNICQLA